MRRKNRKQGRVVLIIIILLVAFGIGAATGIGMGLNAFNDTDNTTQVENVTAEMTSGNHTDSYNYDISQENVNFVDYNDKNLQQNL